MHLIETEALSKSKADRCERGLRCAVLGLLAMAAMGFASSPAVAFDGDPNITRPYKSTRDVVYREVDGVKLYADIFRPIDDGPHPVVLMIHGGAWSSGAKWHLHDHARQLAQSGFVAVTIQYRLAPLHRIEKQFEDCRAALRWVADTADEYSADRQRIAVWGYSAGAHLSCMLATQPAEDAPAIRAVIAGGTPADFDNIPPDSPVLSLVMGGTRNQVPEIYKRFSPVNFVDAKCPPTFLYHGTADALVPLATSKRMHEALIQSGCKSELHIVEGKGHLTTFLDYDARQRVIAFLEKHLTSDH